MHPITEPEPVNPITELREVHQLMEKELEKDALGFSELTRLNGLADRMKELVRDVATDREMQAMHLLNQALDWTTNALPK